MEALANKQDSILLTVLIISVFASLLTLVEVSDVALWSPIGDSPGHFVVLIPD
jgi:hypothetical protein